LGSVVFTAAHFGGFGRPPVCPAPIANAGGHLYLPAINTTGHLVLLSGYPALYSKLLSARLCLHGAGRPFQRVCGSSPDRLLALQRTEACSLAARVASIHSRRNWYLCRFIVGHRGNFRRPNHDTQIKLYLFRHSDSRTLVLHWTQLFPPPVKCRLGYPAATNS